MTPLSEEIERESEDYREPALGAIARAALLHEGEK